MTKITINISLYSDKSHDLNAQFYEKNVLFNACKCSASVLPDFSHKKVCMQKKAKLFFNVFQRVAYT